MGIIRDTKKRLARIEAEIEAELKEVVEIFNPCTGSSLTGAGHGAPHHAHHIHDPIAEYVFRFWGRGGV